MDTLSWMPTLLGRAVYVVLPFLAATCCLLWLSRVAPSLGIVDRPDERKRHVGKVPLIGGPAIYAAVVLSASLLVPQSRVLLFLIFAGGLVSLGIADDILDLPAALRSLVQAAVALAMVWLGGIQIVEIGDLLGHGSVSLDGFASLLFTVFCIIGVVNAINMLDGVDGLAGSVLLMSFAAMAWLGWEGGDWRSTKLLTIFIGALLAFLAFNARVFVRRARVFMGDSGSMLLGFALVWFFISLTQGAEASISPVVAGWLFGLPLMDVVSVVIKRLRERRSPFSAGRDHFHHQLLDAGFSVNETVLTLCTVHGAMLGVGVLANAHPVLEPVLFWGFVALVVFHHFATPVLLARRGVLIR